MTRSHGTSGSTRAGSRPARAIAARMAARSTTAGTPVKSCSSTRAGKNGTRLPAPGASGQCASASTSSSRTCSPPALRSSPSSRMRTVCGSRCVSAAPVSSSRLMRKTSGMPGRLARAPKRSLAISWTLSPPVHAVRLRASATGPARAPRPAALAKPRSRRSRTDATDPRERGRAGRRRRWRRARRSASTPTCRCSRTAGARSTTCGASGRACSSARERWHAPLAAELEAFALGRAARARARSPRSTGAPSCSRSPSARRSAAARAPDGPWLAQNWDWYADAPERCVVWSAAVEGARFATMTEAGILAKVGVSTPRHRRGAQHPLPRARRRGELGHARAPRAAAAAGGGGERRATPGSLLRETPYSASSCITVVDARGGGACFELSPAGVARIEPRDGLLAHTNHFLDETLARDEGEQPREWLAGSRGAPGAPPSARRRASWATRSRCSPRHESRAAGDLPPRRAVRRAGPPARRHRRLARDAPGSARVARGRGAAVRVRVPPLRSVPLAGRQAPGAAHLARHRRAARAGRAEVAPALAAAPAEALGDDRPVGEDERRECPEHAPVRRLEQCGAGVAAASRAWLRANATLQRTPVLRAPA